VHDSIVIQARKEVLHEAVELLVQEMKVCIPLGGGFTIPVDVKVGLNWNDMVKYVKPMEC
jgi:DNA polymerase I-like protein with 3'-5' exonuclease and polymerase domains